MADIREQERQRISVLTEELCKGAMKCFALLEALKCLDDLGVREEFVPLPDEDSLEDTQEAVIFMSLSSQLRALGGLRSFKTRLFAGDTKEAFDEWFEQILQKRPWQYGYKIREILLALLVEENIYQDPALLDAIFCIMAECAVGLERLRPGQFLTQANEEELLGRVKRAIEVLATAPGELAVDFAPVVDRWSKHENRTISELAQRFIAKIKP